MRIEPSIRLAEAPQPAEPTSPARRVLVLANKTVEGRELLGLRRRWRQLPIQFLERRFLGAEPWTRLTIPGTAQGSALARARSVIRVTETKPCDRF
jgi:hypothetical protein